MTLSAQCHYVFSRIRLKFQLFKIEKLAQCQVLLSGLVGVQDAGICHGENEQVFIFSQNQHQQWLLTNFPSSGPPRHINLSSIDWSGIVINPNLSLELASSVAPVLRCLAKLGVVAMHATTATH